MQRVGSKGLQGTMMVGRTSLLGGRFRVLVFGIWFLASLMVAPLHAQTTTVNPEDEYKNLIRVTEDIQPWARTPSARAQPLQRLIVVRAERCQPQR